MSLMSIRRSVIDEWMVFANSVCLSVRFPAGFRESWSDRMSRLLSGVRSSWDMLARNSDLYFDVNASCSAFSSRAFRACSTSWFLRSTSWFWCASSPAFSSSSWLVCCNSCCRLCSSCASDCDCVSRSSVRVFASMVLMTMLIDERLVRGAEPVERGELQDALDLAFEDDRQHQNVLRRRGAQARENPDVVDRHVRQQDLLLVHRALPHQALAQLDAIAERILTPGAVAREQRQPGLL